MKPAGTSGVVAAATVEDFVDNPAAYFGERVTLSGRVGDVLGARAFNVKEEGIVDVDDELLVLAPKVTEDSAVQVRRTVRRLVTRDLEATYGPTYWTKGCGA